MIVRKFGAVLTPVVTSEPAHVVVDFQGCNVNATMDGAGGFIVRVMQGKEPLLTVHVPSPEKRGNPQYWTATDWGGLLLRKLYAEESAKKFSYLRSRSRSR